MLKIQMVIIMLSVVIKEADFVLRLKRRKEKYLRIEIIK